MDLDLVFLKTKFKDKIYRKSFKLKEKWKTIHWNYTLKIDLQSSDIKTINDCSFKTFIILKDLNLNNNLISKLSKNALYGLKNLTRLDLSSNQIDTINSLAFKSVKKLEYLNLSDNQINNLNWLNSLNSLEVLHLNNNRIQSIDYNSFQSLVDLTELKLSYNQIESIENEAFNSLINLKLLDLDGNQLSKICFNGLSALNWLILSHNLIESLDETSLSGLVSLEKLDIDSNRITIINEDSFKDLINLKLLNLSANKLTSTSLNSFKHLTNLVDINLFYNQLDTIGMSTFKYNTKLNSLDLCYNKIQEISSESFNQLIDLKYLNLNHNQLSYLNPKILSNNSNLEALLITNNKLTKLESDQFFGLFNLKLLKLSNNQIISIKEDAFKSLSNLEEFFLNGNRLETLNCNIFNCLSKLMKLNLSCNQIRILNDTFNNAELQVLDLHDNQINHLSDNVFKYVPKLTSLFLHPVKFVLNSSALVALNLENLTLFDEFVIKNVNFERENFEITKQNLQLFCGREFINNVLNATYKLNRNSLVSIKLNDKAYKCLKPGFKWGNIDTKFSAIIGTNGIGKTTVLDFIKESISLDNSDYYVSNYFNTLQNNLYQIKNLNKKIDCINRNNFVSNVYDVINVFSLVQYLDYLLLLDYKLSDLKLDENFFKYKFSKKRLDIRRKEQRNYLNNKSKKQKYYSSVKSIEYYLGLSKEFKLSPGECLILLIQLWKIHATKLKADNANKPIQNKLRILLLDEPDAHMHPKLVKEFISLISNNELDYLNLQIIMTTHNPITVSFIPIENIFELKRTSNQKVIISRIENRSQIISKVSDNLFYIKEKFKIVFIEGSLGDDEAFYSLIYSLVTKDDFKIPVKFQEMGSRQFNQIFKLDSMDTDYSIDEFIFGINDGDFNIQEAYDHFKLDKKIKNEHQINFKRLSRYSIENYIYDPINLLFAINHLLNRFGQVLNKNNENSICDKYINFLDIIRPYESLSDFILKNTNSIDHLNELLKVTNEFYLTKIVQDKSSAEFETIFQLNKFQNKQLIKEISVKFIINNDYSIMLNYYPIILYFKGKSLATYLNEFLNAFYSSINTKKLTIDCFLDLCDIFDPISYYFAFKRYANYFESVNDYYTYRNIKDFLNKICDLDKDENLKTSLTLNEYLFKATDSKKANEILNEIIIKTERKILFSNKSFIYKLKENKIDSLHKVELNQLCLIYNYFKYYKQKQNSDKNGSLNDPVINFFENEILQNKTSDSSLNSNYEYLITDDEIRAEFAKLSIKSLNQKSIKLDSSQENWKYKINRWLLDKFKINLKLIKKSKVINHKSNQIKLEFMEFFDFKSNKEELTKMYMNDIVLETPKKYFINTFRKSGFLIDSHLYEIMKSINS